MDPTLKGIIIALGLMLASAALAGIASLYKRVRALEAEATKVKTQVEPLWTMVQSRLAKDLTHPSKEFHVADGLLKKLVDETITDDEREELLRLMEERITDPNPKVGVIEREKAGAMAFVMRRAKEDQSAPVTEVRMVAITEAVVKNEENEAEEVE